MGTRKDEKTEPNQYLLTFKKQSEKTVKITNLPNRGTLILSSESNQKDKEN